MIVLLKYLQCGSLTNSIRKTGFGTFNENVENHWPKCTVCCVCCMLVVLWPVCSLCCGLYALHSTLVWKQ